MFTKRYLSGENYFQMFFFRNTAQNLSAQTFNNYVVSTIYKLRPIRP